MAGEGWRNRIVRAAEEPPESLLANPRNWRRHPAAQREALRGSLNTVGWVQQVMVNERTGHVVDGHARVEEAISRGEATVPVLYVDLDENEEGIVLATLDPIGAMADQDTEMLRSLVEETTVDDEALRALLGDLLPEPKHGLTDPDDVPDLGEQTSIKRGDIFALGDHRLMCGDATDPSDHGQLLGDATVDLVLTDPPYGVNMDYGVFEDTEDNVRALIHSVMPLLTKWPVVLLTSGHRLMWEYPAPSWVLAWVHPAGNGRSPWGFSMLNPILAYGSDPYLKRGLGSRGDTLVLAADRDGETGHPVIKPVAVWKWLLERGSVARDQAVFDPFSGSGTTIIAAEMLGRRCYAMDIDPRYVAVAIERWEKFTGRKAEKLEAEDPFEAWAESH